MDEARRETEADWHSGMAAGAGAQVTHVDRTRTHVPRRPEPGSVDGIGPTAALMIWLFNTVERFAVQPYSGSTPIR